MRMQILNSPWHTPIDRKTREIDVRQGANQSQVRPRMAEQKPCLRGCGPGAGCKRTGYIAFLCTPTRSHPPKGALLHASGRTPGEDS